MLLGLIFLTLLTILSSLLVMFFTVTPLTSWLVLILSLIGIFIIKKAVILDSIEDPENKNKQKKTVIANERERSVAISLDASNEISTSTTPRNDKFFFFSFLDSNLRWNDVLRYVVRGTGYIIGIIFIFLFYSRYHTFGSSPLVWNILPNWFLLIVGFLILLHLLISEWQKGKEKIANEDLSEAGIVREGRGGLYSDNASPPKPRLGGAKAEPSSAGAIFYFPFLISTILFCTLFLLLPVLFPLGTDYDPFVHRAAEQTIVSQGFIHPRTFLYAGEYGLVSVLATITSLPVKTVNIYLLPILILLFLPWLLKKTFHSSLAPILLFLLPFSILTTTVPQGLGIFFLLVLLLFIRQKNNKITKTQNHENTISLPSSSTPIEDPENKNKQKKNSFGFLFGFFFSFPDSRRSLPRTEFTPYFDTGIRGGNDNTLYPLRYTLYALLALSSFLSHPFTGIAAFILLGFTILEKLPMNNKRFPINSLLHWSLVIGALITSSLLLPLALYLNNYLNSQFSIQSITFNPNAIQTLKSIFNFGWIRYTDPLSTVHFIGKNYLLFFFLIVVFGIYRFIFNKQSTARFDSIESRRVNSQQNKNVIAPVRRSLNEGGSGTKQSSNVIPAFVPESKQQKQTKKNSVGFFFSFPDSHLRENGTAYILSFLSILISSLIILFFFHPNITPLEHTQLFTRIFSISLVFLWPLFLEGIQNLVSRNTEHVSRNQHSMSSQTPIWDPETNTNKKRPFAFFFSFLDSRRSLPRTEFTPYFDTGIRGGNDKISFLPWAPIALLSVLIVSNIYLNFPHSDRFEAHKGYLVSQDDLSTVQEIERRAQKPYLVLANQTVGAAALDQFGFEQYVTEITKTQKSQKQNKNVIAPVRSSVNEGGSGGKQSSIVIPDSIGNPENKKEKQKDANQQWNNETPTVNPKRRVTIRQAMKQYFYSIPISSKAQDYFLQMLKNPSQELVDEIFQTYDIQELYLILNDYWKNSKTISKELTKISNKTISIGSNSIFQFLPTQ